MKNLGVCLSMINLNWLHTLYNMLREIDNFFIKFIVCGERVLSIIIFLYI